MRVRRPATRDLHVSRIRAFRGLAFAALNVIALLLMRIAPAHAQGSSLSGSWRAGATAIDVTIESWGADCGPRPQSTRSSGGGIVNVDQKEQVLLIHGRDQDIRSDACWSRNLAMKRVVASYSNGVWTTRCRTADNDPRAEQGTYSLKLVGSDTLLYQDVTFSTTQTLTRARDAKGQPVRVSRPGPGSAPDAPEERACTPGEPAHLTLRPRRIDLEVGQRVCFRTRITDAADCVIKNVPVEWSLSHSKALRGALNAGCFTAADTAAEAQGEFRISARAAGLQAEAAVSVRPIDLSALVAKRLEGGGALTGFDETPAVKSTPKAVARIAAHTSTQPEVDAGRRALVLGLGIGAVLLTLLGWWWSRRTRSTTNRKPPTRERVSVVLEPGTAPTNTVEASVDSAEPRSGDMQNSTSQRPPGEEREPWICPTCRVGYPAHQGTCPKDGSQLMPYAEFAKRGRRHDEERKKRCPICGAMFPATAGFCGTDGANLIDA
jgi:hypothetical protein